MAIGGGNRQKVNISRLSATVAEVRAACVDTQVTARCLCLSRLLPSDDEGGEIYGSRIEWTKDLLHEFGSVSIDSSKELTGNKIVSKDGYHNMGLEVVHPHNELSMASRTRRENTSTWIRRWIKSNVLSLPHLLTCPIPPSGPDTLPGKLPALIYAAA